MDHNKLIYLPLGGAGEIGMNMYVYGYGAVGEERFILVDVGVSFPNAEQTPGVDLIMADSDWIAARADRLDGIIITHAHEDHIGALGLLYNRFKVPIYCRQFTAHIARAKMEERGQDPTQVKVVAPYPKMQKIGVFEVAFVPISHSIPEASAILIMAGGIRVFHSADFKRDEAPVLGEKFDAAMLSEIGKKGIDVLTCDSTNVFSPSKGRSESSLSDAIGKLIDDSKGMMVATTFASHLARLKLLAQAGVDAGRSVCVMGRSMQRMLGYAQTSGIMTDFPPTIPVEDTVKIPRDQLLLLVTGSQGESRAASAQLARGTFLGVSLKAGDRFLFSSKTIPGNETAVNRIINGLVRQGVQVFDDTTGLYHVSGHANRPDLQVMHDLIQPKCVIPMHGEYRHLVEHAALVLAGGQRDALVVPNGSLVEIDTKAAQIVDHIEVTRHYLDGKSVISAQDDVVRDRVRMAQRGVVSVSVTLEDDETLDIWAETVGLPQEEALCERLEGEIEAALHDAPPKRLRDDGAVKGLVKRAINAVCKDRVGKKPIARVVVTRLE